MRTAIFKLALLFCLSCLCLSQENSAPSQSSPEATRTPEQERSAAPQESQKPPVLVLKEGTEIKLKFAQNVTSRVTRPGQMIEFVVAEPVVVDGVLLIKQGARSIGYVANTESASGTGKGGTMEIRMEAVRTRGNMVKLTGADSRTEKRATGRVVGMTILFGLSGFLSARGHEVKIPEGTPMTAYVAETVEFPMK
jgi:hypothetical protein